MKIAVIGANGQLGADVMRTAAASGHEVLGFTHADLDVRNADEWDAGHAPEAEFLPMSELEARVGELPTDQQVVVICRTGSRSARCTQFLRSMSIDALNLAGGMEAWQAAGLPQPIPHEFTRSA